jgi:hypothetical protein
MATASLTPQSALFQELVANGAINPAQALNVVDKALAASLSKASSTAEQDVALVAVEALEGVRGDLADMVN